MIEKDLPEPEGKRVTVGPHTVHYIDLGDGPPTVFLHGGGPGCSGWTDFGTVADAFAGDRQVLLLDMLHFGRSSKEPIRAPRWSYHAQVIAGALEAIGVTEADFVCNSVGGSAALALAAERPDLVRRLVLTGSEPTPRGAVPPTEELGRKGATAYGTYYDEEGPTPEKLLAIMAELEWHDPAGIPRWTFDLRWELSRDPDLLALGPDWSAAGGRGIPQDLAAHLGAVRAPTLLLWGERDAFLVPDYALGLTRLMPDASLHVMADGAHHMEEERPEEYTAIVKAFLDA
ncbi:alpha/beta fold hydrolase [Streptomyces sp. PT12]|uniref:alpha/beta fold hydrolase n=1 Tax=Streptomyces sp. PT12 TaxID=1510197 RepID=UPI000DE295ED|nr:alpha/beta hydrolase [Streptomyces sp. PT12]RBM15522.1 hydrolase [Streptomyces sp. PT12]